MALRGEVKLMGAKAKVKEMLKASSTNMKCKEQRKRNMRNRMEDIFRIYEWLIREYELLRNDDIQRRIQNCRIAEI